MANLPFRKFEIDDLVVDTFTNKIHTITCYCYRIGESGKPEWFYSFDKLGWYLVPESDLVKYGW